MAKAARKSPKVRAGVAATNRSQGGSRGAVKKPSKVKATSDAKNRPKPKGTDAAGGILAYNAAQSPGDRRICDALARAIQQHLAASGAAGLESRIWHGHPVWFLEGNPIVGYSKLKDCIRLLFWSGQSFDEPGLKPEGSFKAAEARYTAENQIAATELKRWLDKAIEIQWDYKNIVKRKGRLERLK